MMLRLTDEPRTFDFRLGRNGYGHQIHSGTFRAAAPRVEGHLWWRKKTDRVEVMAHCQSPREGDFVLYTTKSGKVRRCVIVEVQPCGDPRDMYTLILEKAPDADPHG